VTSERRASPARSRPLRLVARAVKRRSWVRGVFRGVATVLPGRAPTKDPIFIIGSPRSGTTMLFEILDRSSQLASVHGESHFLWQLFHPFGGPGWSSHEVLPEQITGRERRALYWMIHLISGDRRYLDKSPRNSLRVPYLRELFPTAWFLFLRRDGRATVSSLINGWRTKDGIFPGTALPHLCIDGYEGSRWKFLVPPGWEAYATGKSLAEICAFQWVASNQAILSAREQLDTDRWVDISYEDLVRSPRREVERVLGELGIPAEEEVLGFADALDQHVTKAITPPREDKWRQENPEEIERILPLIDPMMRRLGYDPYA